MAISPEIEALRVVIGQRPGDAGAHMTMGNLLYEHAAFNEAADCYRRVIELLPDHPDAWNNLGSVLYRIGRPLEAVECLEKVLAAGFDLAAVHNNLGNALSALRRYDDAAKRFQRALELDPACVEAWNNLGTALHRLGKPADAMNAYRKALTLRPDASQIFNNFGNVLKELGRLDEALACYDRALTLGPENADLLNNIGNALKDGGELDKAMEAYRRALGLNPDHIGAHSALLYSLYFHPAYDGGAIYEEHVKWNQRHSEPLAANIRPHTIDRTPGRRLRVGYVSPDFREHAVGRFLLPLLEHHDHAKFEIACYSDVTRPDAVTARLAAAADLWRETASFTHQELSEEIRQDQIDILVDLTMHMAGSRLLTFARKPAPVQVTWLAYCGTTGLKTIDYRLSDPFLDPETDDGFYSEKTVRLARSYWCYQPPDRSPAIVPLPALSTGEVTFGCLNNYCKITEPAWAAWISILQSIPRSRLLLHAYEGHHRDVAQQRLSRAGIDPARLDFAGFLPLEGYLRQYQQIDIALDPFPYTGGTTTCDALWMGVPVISLAGRTAVSRGGLSILSNIGRPQWAARDVKQYIRIATELAADLTLLAEERATLRDRMLRSPLTDAPAFARDIETAFLEMWRGITCPDC